MVAQIIVDVSSSEVDKIFEYAIPQTMSLETGYRVKVPFGKRVLEGYVLEITEEKTTSHDLKEIIEILDPIPVITKEQLCLAEYMKNHYHLRMVDILHLFIPVRAQTKPQYEIFYSLKKGINLNDLKIRANAKNQKALLEDLKIRKISQVEINKIYGNSTLSSLKKIGILEEEIVRNYRVPKIYEEKKKQIQLTLEQQNAVEKIHCNNKTKVLFGVTGSGKTEVYMQCIENVLKQNKTAIMLVPEISLTPQTMGNFRSRFGDNVALIHSALSIGERFDEWDKILNNEVKIVVGARSAIFSPLKNVGLIIIDEEHDSSYYSESNPRYYTHEVAKFRAMYNRCPLVLGSATPSIESMLKVNQGEFSLIKMLKRVNNYPLPKIEIVDMVNEIRNGNNSIFSKKFIYELTKTIDSKKQAMILLNRRGFQSTVRCLECGYVAKCTNCDVSLVYHKEDDMLKCHYCNMRYRNLTQCPKCENEKLSYGAMGTQKLVEELQKHFPNVPILRMDNDSTRGKDGHNKILEDFRNTFPSILVGTQMIAKGHDYPLVTFVGIVDADASLHFADYRATEKTFSLITQVSGRAGRAGVEGVVVLQTYSSNSSIYNKIANYDYEGFYTKELRTREMTLFPPFTKMVRILITSLDSQICENTTKSLYEKSLNLRKKFDKSDIVYLDCMKSPVKRIQNKFRYQILFRIKNNVNEIIDKIYKLVDSEKYKNCTVFVEINPQSLQ